MIWRSLDGPAMIEALGDVVDTSYQSADEWISNLDNIALRNPQGDFALFEYRQPGVYTGHYFFKSRGKEAVHAAEDFLHDAFDNRGIHVIIGLTPHDKKGAMWLSRHLGFHIQGDEEIDGKMHRVFVLTKEDYE